MTKRLQYASFALIGAALGWFLLSNNDKQSRNINVFEPAIESKRSNPISAKGYGLGELNSKLPNNVLPVTSITDLLSLSTGDVVSLESVSDEGSNDIEISISQIDVQNGYTQMQGTTADNGIAIITVGVQTVNVFIKEASGLYEFSGKDFNGKVPKIEKIVWGDDIYVYPQPTVLEEEPLLAPVERAVQR